MSSSDRVVEPPPETVTPDPLTESLYQRAIEQREHATRLYWQMRQECDDAKAELQAVIELLTWRQRLAYWLRPYDWQRDARCWHWQVTPCRYVVASEAPRAHTAGRVGGEHS
jgi:hypothetical protein